MLRRAVLDIPTQVSYFYTRHSEELSSHPFVNFLSTPFQGVLEYLAYIVLNININFVQCERDKLKIIRPCRPEQPLEPD